MQYNFDFGAVTRTQGPPPQGQSVGAIKSFTYDSFARIQQVSLEFNGNADYSHTRFEYSTSQTRVDTYTTIEAGLGEAHSFRMFDGHGRVIASASDHPGSVGGFSGQLTLYSKMGQVVKQSNPTETSASGAPSQWVAAGDDAQAGWLYTQQTYDWKGRPLLTTNTDGTTKQANYAGCGCAGGEVVTLTDEGTVFGGATKKRQQKIYSDVLGRNVKTEVFNWDGAGPFGTAGSVYSATVNTYNARDQVTRVRQFEGPDSSSVYQDTVMTYDGYARLKTKHVPEQNTGTATTYNYNSDDTVLSEVDARGASATYSYNNRHLVTGIAYSAPYGITATPNVSFSYDSAGNRTSMTDGLGSQSYAYDQLSRLTSESRTITGVGTYPLSYAYNLAGALISVTNPFGAQVGYNYDAAGRVNSVTGSNFANVSTYASNLQYRAWGALKQLDYGNTRTLSMTYNSRLQPASFTVPGVMSKTYDYRADGRRSFSHDLIEPKFDRSYTYDQAGRITEAFSGAEARNEGATDLRPYKETFNYDALGHLTGRPVNRVWAGPGGAFSPAEQTYQNERNTVWQYDADGNLTDSGYVQYTIDAAGQATRTVSQTIIPFNGDPNQHIRSIDADLTRSYDGDGNAMKDVVVETIHDDDDMQQDETTTTTSYQVRSTVLGKVVMETSPESGLRGFVYLGSEVLAWQLPDSEVPPAVNWEHRDPGNASFRLTPLGSGLKGQAELDPLGTDAATSNPTTPPSVRKSFMYPGFGDYSMRSDSQCLVDGFMKPCAVAFDAVNRRAAKVDSVSGSVPNYMTVEVSDPEAPDDTPEDPNNPLHPVTIRDHYHYELVYTGHVTTTIEQRQPENPGFKTGRTLI